MQDDGRQEVVFEMEPFHTPRVCSVCCDPATKTVFRANAAGIIDRSSRRFACNIHATVEALYPQRGKPRPRRYVGMRELRRSTAGSGPAKIRHHRLPGMSGRQWVKYRKAEGLSPKSR